VTGKKTERYEGKRGHFDQDIPTRPFRKGILQDRRQKTTLKELFRKKGKQMSLSSGEGRPSKHSPEKKPGENIIGRIKTLPGTN